MSPVIYPLWSVAVRYLTYTDVCYRPTYSANYGADVHPGRYDNGAYASPPRQAAPPADDWMYGCPQSRTFKILQSVVHNEGLHLLTLLFIVQSCKHPPEGNDRHRRLFVEATEKSVTAYNSPE